MAKIVLITDDCTRKTSPNCEGTFTYQRKMGRPPVACKQCIKPKPRKTDQAVTERPTEGKCGCGKTFAVARLGRPATRCEDCRDIGTVWRTDEDGVLQMIRAAQISREEQDRKDEAGDMRAQNLIERMKLLHEKKNRTIIVR
jgi:hypothetical protein